MTEREKMVRGLLYWPGDGELAEARDRCKTLCQQFNQLVYRDMDAACAALNEALPHAGQGFWMEPPFWCDYGWNITAGKNLYMNHGCVILDAGGVTFGDDVQVGPQCGFHTSGHPLDAEERRQGLEFAKPIRVGSGVWFGAGCHVMPGVTIGDGAVIAAGSVVTHDIPAGVLAAGVPCRVLRPITETDRLCP